MFHVYIPHTHVVSHGGNEIDVYWLTVEEAPNMGGEQGALPSDKRSLTMGVDKATLTPAIDRLREKGSVPTPSATSLSTHYCPPAVGSVTHQAVIIDQEMTTNW